VAVIGDPPALTFQPDTCLANHTKLPACTSKLVADQITVYTKARQAATHAGAAFLNTIGWFCYDDLCPAVVGHTVSYRTHDHITKTYGEQVRYRFRSAFLRVVSP